MNRGVHNVSCIMGNQGKMVGNSKVYMETQSPGGGGGGGEALPQGPTPYPYIYQLAEKVSLLYTFY